MSGQRKIVLWTGPRHSGKTAAADKLIECLRAQGHTVAGLLAPSVYEGGILFGFDALDVSTGQRSALLRLAERADAADVGRFALSDEGLRIGQAALSGEATRQADLVVVDEFGSLELRGGGWRTPVDGLIDSAVGVILLVVREGLIAAVRGLYPGTACVEVRASDPKALDAVMAVLAADP